MHMIRHDNGNVKKVLGFVIVKATLQGDIAGGIGQDPTMKRAKSYEVALIITCRCGSLRR
jgi:hypothetical protein